MSSDVYRNRYQASGRVNWGVFLGLYALALLCAALGAGLLYWLFVRGWYLVILVPMLAALLPASMMRAAVGMGKCRSVGLAWAAGFVAGAVMYLGYYYIGLVALVGVRNAGRVDLLPEYISFRIHSDIAKDVGHRIDHDSQPNPGMNWFGFGIELCGVLYLTGMLAGRRASRSFCERCNRWKDQDVALFPPGSGKLFRQWLESGEIGRLATAERYVPRGERQKFTSVIVELCPRRDDAEPCPVYLAAKDVVLGGSQTAFQRFDGSPGKMRIARTELAMDEAVALEPLFPRLHSALAGSTGPAGTSVTETLTTPVMPPGAYVETRLVPEQEAGKVMNTKSVIIGNLVSLVPLIVMVASIGGVALGIYYSRVLEVLDHKSAAEPARLVPGLFLAGVSILFLILSGYIGLKNAGIFANHYYLSLAKRHFIRRRNPMVNFHAPGDLPTFFVEVVPRKNWSKVMLETAADMGFLQVDPRRREVRFEGDKEQYRIPAAAILECSVHEVPATPGNTSLIHHMVLVRAAARDGTWEAPFCLRQTKWLVSPNHRKESGAMIHQSIASILPRR